MSGLHGRTFADRLALLARHTADPRCAALARRLARPVTVAVHGRPGVGVATVARALTAAGVPVHAEGDIAVRVLAEVAKPEDLTVRPDLYLLNKADLAGFGHGGPMAAARDRAALLTRRVGVPVEPLAALLAVAALDARVLDDAAVRALRVLVTAPADLSSPDAFVAAPHPLPRDDRRRLLRRLDLFGIAHTVLALGDAGQPEPPTAAALRAGLRRVSRIDEVCARIDAAAAEVRYRRLLSVSAELEAMAVQRPELARHLADDATAAARMAAAAEAMAAAGLAVDVGDDAHTQLRTAVRWRRYGAGPVGALHRACAADISRGALRLRAAR